MRKVSTFSSMLYNLMIILTSIVVTPCALAQLQNTTFVPVAPENLSSSFTRSICKDSKGFMWFGTSNGLLRYDGTSIYRYEHTPGDNKTICSNKINAVIEDANQNLWIGTAQGLARYNREKDNFIDVDSIPGNKNYLTNRYITALGIDHQGRVWIGSHGHGVSIYDPKTLTFTYLIDKRSGNQTLPTNYVMCFFLVDDVMWTGTKGGLKLFSTSAMRTLPLPNLDKSIITKEITQVTQDLHGNMWLGTGDREIIKLKSKNENYEVERIVLEPTIEGEMGANILTLCFDASGNLWVGGENTGLNYLDTKSFKITHYKAENGNPKKLPTNSIRYVYVDNTGITWVGTYNKGIYLIDNNAKKFDSYQRTMLTKDGLLSNNIKGLTEDKEGNIWIAYDGGGLCKLDVKTHELQCDETINNKLESRYLSSLLYDTHGNLWIGTWGRGIYYLNLRTRQIKNYALATNAFGDNKVYCLYEDSKKNIWAGTMGSGLFYFDSKAGEFISFNKGKKVDYISKTAYITSVREDAQGKLWVSTLYGLFCLTKGADNSLDFVSYYKNDQTGTIGSNEILTIHEDLNQNMWFGTDGNGIVMLPANGSKFKVIQKKDGQLSNSVRGILTDVNGDVWISGSMGLSKYNLGTHSFWNYTKDDGLPSNEFNVNACLKARDGKFYFGSDNGLVAFYPDSIRDNLVRPVVYLTDLKLDNQSVQIDSEGSPLNKHISLTGSIELQYSQRSFAIDFVAINYGQSSRNQYCYKLEGFDKNWNCVGSGNRASYTNIDPGNYVFLVKAANSDGIASQTPARLAITIRQAPWKTKWAILFYLAVCTAFVYILIKIRIERIKFKTQLELERMAREKEHALSESKTQFFTNISHELRTPLSLIAMPLESLISRNDLSTTVKERLVTIRSSTDKMTRLVNELLDFNKLEDAKLKLHIQYGELVKLITDIAIVFNDLAAKRNIHFGIHAMVRSLEGWFDHDKLEKILVNVLSNAFKFTSDHGQINVVINSKDSTIAQSKTRCLELSIVDNGIGISEEELPFIFDKFYQTNSSVKVGNPGTGIGLSLTKGLVELHYGSITAESTPNSETKFVILLPIDRHVYAEDVIDELPSSIVQPQATTQVETDNTQDEAWISEDDKDKAQILVVEDNEELRKYISLELRQQFNVWEAKNGKEGLDLAFEKSPDLIVSDILMPIKTGIELCKEIKSNLKTSHIPFILLTAKTAVDDQVEGIATGADVYITKPFSIRLLMTQVNQIIESRQKLYSRFSQDVYLLPSKVSSNEIDQAFLQKAIDYIIENIQDSQLGVDSIADLFNLSRMQVYRKIKALTGKSVVDFIRMVRIKQALKLMDMQKYTLSEIAYQTGFNSASYFTRCFKGQFGKAPSDYLASKLT